MSSSEATTGASTSASPEPLVKTCPVSGEKYEYIAPGPGDSRSPCPALNTMANHGYINRDGKDLSAWSIARGLVKCYGLTTPFSMFLSYTTFLLLRKFPPVDLYEIGKHGAVEHNASLVHRDTSAGDKYAPIEVDKELLAEFVKDARTEVEVETSGKKLEKLSLLTIPDVGRARVRREKVSPLDAVHAEIARGEVAIILGVWETKAKTKEGMDVTGTRMDWLERWLGEERLPDDWSPTRGVGLFETMKRAKAIKLAAEAVRAAEAAKKD